CVQSGASGWRSGGTISVTSQPPLARRSISASSAGVDSVRLATTSSRRLVVSGMNPSLRGRLLAAQRRAQVLLLLVAQRRLDDFAAVRLEPLEQLVAGRGVAERDQRGAAGRQLGAQLLDEVVVDADVGELAGDRARRGADGDAQQRGEEQQADQAAP